MANSLSALCDEIELAAVPRYSLLASVSTVSEVLRFAQLADFGIRVFLLVHELAEPEILKLLPREFLEARLIEFAFSDSSMKSVAVVDGHASNSLQRRLLEQLPFAFGGNFNVEQYFVVHAPLGKNTVVRAGAGTGKTETMAERIVFLLAMEMSIGPDGNFQSEFNFGSIALVTFTNLATNEMRARINRVIIYRHRLCRRNALPTLHWISGIGRIRISTIHKFALSLVREHGREIGFGPDVVIGSNLEDFRRWVFDGGGNELGEIFGDRGFAWDRRSFVWRKTLERIWATIVENGIDLNHGGSALDWGGGLGLSRTDQQATSVIEKTMKYVAKRVDESNLKNQKIETNLIVTRAVQAVHNSTAQSTQLKYLFVDEFQDSDPGQIELFRYLSTRYAVQLFLVGDVKQGVYRFRGASGNAFEIVNSLVERNEISPPEMFSLNKNFRSGPALLTSLSGLFSTLGSHKLLDYEPALDTLIPGKTQVASSAYQVIATTKARMYQRVADLVAEVRLTDPDSTVGILVRENSQASLAQQAVRDVGMSCEIVSGGTFFQSDAVRELRAFVAAILSPEDNARILELVETRWGTGIIQSDIPELADANPDSRWPEVGDGFIDWRNRTMRVLAGDQSAFRDIEPFRARIFTLKRLALRLPLLDWVVYCRNHFLPDSVSVMQQDDDLRRKQFGRNLDHLLTLLDDVFGGSGVTLQALLDYLDVHIAVDNSVDEVHVDEELQASGVTVALTVHKAKGLEFDHVFVLPSERVFRGSEIAIYRGVNAQPLLIWEIHQKGNWNQVIRNVDRNHPAMADDALESAREEARLFYVAMTRGRRTLTFVSIRNSGSRSTGVLPKSWDDFMMLGGAK